MLDDKDKQAPAQDNADRVNISTDSQKLETEFQKFITDESPLQNAFYSAFSGWRFIVEIKKTTVLGKEIEEKVQKIEIDEGARILNESGANYIFASIKPLISPLVSTSSLSEMQIYKLWRSRVRTIRHKILASYFFGVNPYELKDSSAISDITTSILGLYTITSKAKNGFTLTELAESFITSVIQKSGNRQEKQEGLVDSIKNVFSGKRGG